MVAHVGQPENYSVCSEMRNVWAVKVGCNAYAKRGEENMTHHEYYILSRGCLFRQYLVVMEDEGGAILCSLTNNTQDMNWTYYILQVKWWNRNNSGIHFPSSWLHLGSHFLRYLTYHQPSEPAWYYLTCITQHLSFQNIHGNPDYIVHSLCAPFRYMKLYHNATAFNVDSFSTHSNDTKGQPQWKREGNYSGRNANIG